MTIYQDNEGPVYLSGDRCGNLEDNLERIRREMFWRSHQRFLAFLERIMVQSKDVVLPEVPSEK